MAGSAREHKESPLKILMTADAVGGVWQYAADLITGLVERGAEVLLATLGPRPSAAQKRQLPTFGVTLAESDYALEWMPNRWDDVDAAGEWLRDLATSFQPNIIHLNGYSHARLPWRRPVVVVAHSCVYSWWRAVHGCAPGTEWDEYKYHTKEGLAAADVAIAPSACMAEAICREYEVRPEKCRTIHNFSRAKTVGQSKEPFILAAGRLWDPAKNLSLLDRISSRLNWKLVVAGSDRGPENSAGSAKAARFLGPLPHSELMSQMARASIFAHSALYEPFGLCVLEAARAKCCLLLSDIPSLRELWDGAALFADPRDPEQWLFELNLLSNDFKKRESLAAAAFAHAARYSTDQTVDLYWAIYQSLLGLKSSANREVAA